MSTLLKSIHWLHRKSIHKTSIHSLISVRICFMESASPRKVFPLFLIVWESITNKDAGKVFFSTEKLQRIHSGPTHELGIP